MFKEGEYFSRCLAHPHLLTNNENLCTSDTFPDSIGEPVKMIKQVIYNVKRNDVSVY